MFVVAKYETSDKKGEVHFVTKKYNLERLKGVGGTRLRGQEVSSTKNSIKMSV
jgi:hypothetical protein